MLQEGRSTSRPAITRGTKLLISWCGGGVILVRSAEWILEAGKEVKYVISRRRRIQSLANTLLSVISESPAASCHMVMLVSRYSRTGNFLGCKGMEFCLCTLLARLLLSVISESIPASSHVVKASVARTLNFLLI